MDTIGINDPEAFLSLTSKDAELSVISCKGYWDATDATWIRMVPQGSTVWLARDTGLYRLLENNQAKGKETILLVPSLAQSRIKECARLIAMGDISAYRTIWVLQKKDGGAKDLATYYLGLAGNLLCKAGMLCAMEDNGTSGFTASSGPFWILARNCNRVRGQALQQRGALLKDTSVNVACMNFNREPPTHSCDVYPLKRLISLLRRLNVTVREKVFSDEKSYGYEIVRSSLDIAMTPVPAHERLMLWFDFPAVVNYVHITFYSRKEKGKVTSFYAILKKSRVAFAFLVGSFLVCAVTLLLMDVIEYQSSFLDHAYDSAMVLLAPVFVTSTAMPVWRLWKRSRNLTLSFWFFAIFPLSTYMRSHLISTLSIREVPDPLDTIDELEEALDKGSLFPCLVDGSSVHYEYNINASPNSLAQKISLAFHKNKQRKNLVDKHPEACFKCALRPSHVCIINEVQWFLARQASRDLVESRDKLRPIFITTLTRKTFPLKAPYRQFLLRVHETGLLHVTNVFSDDIRLLDGSADETNQLLELTGFFKFFLLSLIFTVGTLTVEIILHRILQFQSRRYLRSCGHVFPR
ncbi:hypothetical protein HPB49_000475 [Dermacentor silvarum]|uniref:Uncharacterized protein n=1 Tax=Dermacentor silvarum TaxID=543639 RepID=A0ACB8CCQ6_DERSI|nr:hypothetical protein HPB49_000475 [Dermacentor silvarum]